jgi:DNA mismatch endonuclease (patch repair protein)
MHRIGLRFRLHDRNLPGTPDLVLKRHSTVVFVHGCFWHRHTGCRFCTTPGTNVEFWAYKFTRNIIRDREASAALEAQGWRVICIWECELADEASLRLRIQALFPHLAEPFGPGGNGSVTLR